MTGNPVQVELTDKEGNKYVVEGIRVTAEEEPEKEAVKSQKDELPINTILLVAIAVIALVFALICVMVLISRLGW